MASRVHLFHDTDCTKPSTAIARPLTARTLNNTTSQLRVRNRTPAESKQTSATANMAALACVCTQWILSVRGVSSILICSAAVSFVSVGSMRVASRNSSSAFLVVRSKAALLDTLCQSHSGSLTVCSNAIDNSAARLQTSGLLQASLRNKAPAIASTTITTAAGK